MVMHFAQFCSKTLLAMKNQVFNILIVIVEIAASNAVYWVLKTPVVFGDSATLTCMVEQKDNCDSEATRRWDGGLNKNILLINGHSTNASKYYEVAYRPCYNFSLVIMDFGMNDVNCEYRCSLDFETSRQMLTLDSRHFIGVPSENDISFNLGQTQTELNLQIQFHNVYPIPKCKVEIGHENWVDNFLDTKPNGMFFDASLLRKTDMKISQCDQNVKVICTLLSLTIFQFDTILNCTETSIKFGSALYFQISFGILIFIIIVAVSCVVICRKTMTDEETVPPVQQTNERHFPSDHLGPYA
ncbi:uncharacterized protein LOC127711934 [Mytilus californianus]|uniref:uncharacterized protein LOC127711934 n=1 Tax=Mytilus californianus TaxID=6549 RepID=UPI00224739C8|nr:uncharacterized protein LOC127711934 [Mytilus californianus]